MDSEVICRYLKCCPDQSLRRRRRLETKLENRSRDRCPDGGETNHVEGKVVIITGAGSGFGKPASEKLATMGTKTVLAERFVFQI